MNYRDKLILWNSTDKYTSELKLLYNLIQPLPGELILDFGCGLMTAINVFNNLGKGSFCGYDITEYGEQEDYHLYDRQLQRKYDTIYFMHSLAHLDKPIETLSSLHNNLILGGKIVIITPNKDWLDKDYNGDETVKNHYTPNTLKSLISYAGYSVIQQGQFGEVKNKVHERLFMIAK